MAPSVALDTYPNVTPTAIQFHGRFAEDPEWSFQKGGKMRRLLPASFLCVVFLGLGVEGWPDSPSPMQRRERLLRLPADGGEVLSTLAHALEDPNAVVRRTATRLLAERGAPARDLLRQAFQDQDVVVRRTALLGLLSMGSPDRMTSILSELEAAVRDSEPLVRLAAVTHLAGKRPLTSETERLLKLADDDEVESIRALATRALWPFHTEKKSLRERADYDHDIAVVQTIPLPEKDWRFKLDPDRKGHLKGWFDPGLDDKEWNTVSIGHAWQEEGYDYVGVAWYRRRFSLPKAPQHTAVDLHFKGVDESAWVWVNGVYVGDHDVGPTGWNQPFCLDATEALLWGQENQITVRAMNTANAGGVWLPVALDVLQ